MDNALESLSMIVGVILFIAAITFVMWISYSFDTAYDEVLYKSIDSSILYR